MFVWEVSGGPLSAAFTAPNYYGQFIEAAQKGGMAAVTETEFFAQRIQENPSNRDKLLSMPTVEFVVAMQRWQTVYSAPNPVSDLPEEQLKSFTCPIALFEGNSPDEVHHKSAAESVHRLALNAELRPSAWTQAEWDVIGQHDHTLVIAARRRLIKMAHDLQSGIEPTAALKPEVYNVRAVDQVSPEADFLRFMDLYADATLGKVEAGWRGWTPTMTEGGTWPIITSLENRLSGSMPI